MYGDEDVDYGEELDDAYGQQMEDDDDESTEIDLANMNDKDKLILLQYLHDEYRKNPDWNGGLPMSKEEVEHFLQENADLLRNLED